MEQRKRYGRRTHLLLSAALLVLCVLLCLPACSDMILNPDGSISRPGTMTLDNGTGVPDPTGTGSTAGAGRIRDTGTIVQRHGSGTADAAVRVQDHIRAGGQAQQDTQHQQCRGKQQMRPPPVPFSLFHMPTSRF